MPFVLLLHFFPFPFYPNALICYLFFFHFLRHSTFLFSQVKSTVQVLADLQLLGPGQVDRLPDRPRYCLFGFLALLFVWLDLFLFKKLFQSVATVVTWSKNRLRAKEDAGETICWCLNHGGLDK